uniref:Uncharacterized protein n=1 Tax=Oryzias latipes TaxID=8090 RepID=A0A3P9HWC1_ORYLA
MEPSSPKKIQFAAPPLQGQLDPQALFQIPCAAQSLMGPIESVHKVDHDCQKDLSDLQLCCFLPLQASDPFQKKQSTYAPPTMTGKH